MQLAPAANYNLQSLYFHIDPKQKIVYNIIVYNVPEGGAAVLYGNESMLSALRRMTEGNRLAQCLLFYGDKGLGKKAIAKWFAQRLLCSCVGDKPCGKCKNCRTIEKNVHPDVIWVPHSGKLQGFSVETVRSVCSEAVIAPNSGDRKIYIFDDCDRMDVRAQNILLKIIEEPPAFTYFIFTAGSRQALLPTIISRLVPFAVSSCSEAEALTALSNMGFMQEDAQEAVAAFHGNIGRCIGFLEDENVKQMVSLTKEAVRCIIDKREYDLLRIFYDAGKDRDSVRWMLHNLELVFRDALVFRLGQDISGIGCDPVGAGMLAGRLSAAKGQHYHKCIGKAYEAVDANVNLQLVLSALCAELMGGK